MKIRHIRSRDQFEEHCRRTEVEREALRAYENSLARNGKREFTVPGYSYPAGRQVDLLVDYLYSGDGSINWRERLVCPITNLNNRVRASLHLLDIELAPYQNDDIFISEQVTPLFQFLKPRYPNLVGSEFLGADVPAGYVNENGIRHENMTQLSFATESLHYILSFDCFEHFPEFENAFKECWRVLKVGGKMLWSVPFVASNSKNTIRARVINGEIEHVLPPEYHGDPVNPQGCLCFTHFGWEMLDQARASGFSDAYAIPYESQEFAYLGPGQLVFVAHK